MRYEISCFIQEDVFTAAKRDGNPLGCIPKVELTLSQVGLPFTIEVRDLKIGKTIYWSAHIANSVSDSNN